MQKDLHEPYDRKRSEAESELALPTGEFGALLLAGTIFALCAMFGPSALVGAMTGLATTTVASLSTAITKMSGTFGPRLKADAAEYPALLALFSQAKPAGTRDYNISRSTKYPGFLSNSVRGNSGDRCPNDKDRSRRKRCSSKMKYVPNTKATRLI